MRCVWTIGCPSEIRPSIDEGAEPSEHQLSARRVFRRAFKEILPEHGVPDIVGVSCCAQFGVTRETMRLKPRQEYVRMRNWLLDTSLDDYLAGKVFEYSWHSELLPFRVLRRVLMSTVIFGKDAVFCPSALDCYCNVYGLCDTACTQRKCDVRYNLPPFSTLPEG